MKKKVLNILKELKSILPDSATTQKALEHIEKEVNIAEFPDAGGGVVVLEKPEIKGGFDVALFSDGACRGNPGPGGWGVLAQNELGEILFEASGFERHTTNNRMELIGAIESLKKLQDIYQEEGKLAQLYSQKLILMSDSKYVVDGIEKWVPGWKKRGWKKADKKDPENLDLWQSLDQICGDYLNLSFQWVKGHSGHPQNERCDELANMAIDDSL